MSHKYNNILEELYNLEPNLKTREKELISLIDRMLALKPHAKIDDDFRRELRDEVLKMAQDTLPKKTSQFSLQILLPIGLSLGFASLFGLWLYNPGSMGGIEKSGEVAFSPIIVHTGSQAFGKKLIAQVASPAIPPQEMSSMSTSPSSDTMTPASNLVGKRMATDMIMPYEPTWYRYVYTGSLNIPTGDMTVYRVEHSSIASDEILGFISKLDFIGINLSSLRSLSDLQITNMSLIEQKKYGYQVNIDFQNGGINLYQNYSQWNCEGDKCTTPLTSDDLPSEQLMISKARDFLDGFGIDPLAYGTPYVQENLPMIAYARAEGISAVEKRMMDIYTIVFPIKLEGMTVYQEYGGAKGLSLTYDVRSGRISSLSGLEKTSYTASRYPVISEEKKLKDMIRSGSRYIQDESQFGTGKIVDIPLGNPTLGYVSMSFYDMNTGNSSEYITPAYIFGVLQKPENWYGQNQVIIPLVDIQ